MITFLKYNECVHTGAAHFCCGEKKTTSSHSKQWKPGQKLARDVFFGAVFESRLLKPHCKCGKIAA